jgi:hypothetical protein
MEISAGLHSMTPHVDPCPPRPAPPRTPAAADPGLPGRRLADLGQHLPGHQVGAGELSAVLADGHALHRRRRAAGGLDALARRALAHARRMDQRHRAGRADARRGLWAHGGGRGAASARAWWWPSSPSAPRCRRRLEWPYGMRPDGARRCRHRASAWWACWAGRGAGLLGIARGAAGGAGGLGGLEAGQRVDAARPARRSWAAAGWTWRPAPWVMPARCWPAACC